ncbi:MAG: TolC family protein [Bacteroidales bacterium]|jgi:outer membrane protein TolC|nr:TolC family protein [Bacteroidales bacterium]
MRIEKLIIPFIFYVITTPFSLLAQQKLTMQECQQWAIEQSSASSQLENFERLRQIKRQVIKSFIPEISLNASASYQSHTLPTIQSNNNTSYLDINNPINKDQYLISLDLTQKIWDGGISKGQQKYDDITSDIAVQNVHITSYEFKEEIGKMFLTVLYLQENIKVIESSILTLKEDLKKLKALYANGIMLESNVYILEAEIMRIEQELKKIELQQQSIRSALSEFTKKDLRKAEFVLTVTESIDTTLESNRPEFTLFQLQQSALESQKKVLVGQSMPKINIFASGGYGRPTYNLVSNDFDFMYIVGAQLHVPITSWGAAKNGNDYLEIQKNLIASQADAYRQNLRVKMMEKLNEMESLKNLLSSDDQIIDKRTFIVSICKKQLEEGVITANDYIKEINALNEVMLNKELHKIQLEQAKMIFNSLKGRL